MDDASSENKQPTAKDRFNAAWDAEQSLIEELKNMQPNQITPEMAPAIAALLVYRDIEIRYLMPFAYDSVRSGEKSHSGGQSFFDSQRRAVTKPINEAKEALEKAGKGDYAAIKDQIDLEIKRLDSDANSRNAESQASPEDIDGWKKQLITFRAISDNIPTQGPPLITRPPIPAWMETPPPLKIQLDQIRGGESN